MIILNTREAALELFDRRSTNYSQRPRFVMVVELMAWDYNLAFIPYGQQWRDYRKVFHQSFHARAAKKYQPWIKDAVQKQLLVKLLQDPESYYRHLRLYTATISLSSTYGIAIDSEKNPYVELSEEAVNGLIEACVPGRFLCDTFPWLKYIPSWVPGAGFRSKAQHWRDDRTSMIETPWQAAKANIANGTSMPCFVSDRLAEMPQDEVAAAKYEEIVKHISATTYAAGADTSVAALMNFLRLMVQHPRVAKLAQEELDRVLKPGVLPTFEDEDSLPYMTAIIKETLRMYPPLPMSVPHAAVEEDEYNGYRIPKGSLVFGNAWSILHDETIYPDAYTFKPERFLLDGKLNPAVRDPAAIGAFGFGRRECPGKHFAYSTTWLAAASILAAFDVEKFVDVDGTVVEPIEEFVSALIVLSKVFKCSIKPRSAMAEKMIREHAES